jgi:hypothetical protein
MQVGSRQSITVNLATDGGGLSQGGIDLLPVDVSGASRCGQHQGCSKRKQRETVLHGFLLFRPVMFRPREASAPAMQAARRASFSVGIETAMDRDMRAPL